MSMEEVRSGMILEDLDVTLNEDENIWTILNGKLEEPIEFDGKPTLTQVQTTKDYYGYSKAKMSLNEEMRLIVISPFDVSAISYDGLSAADDHTQ